MNVQFDFDIHPSHTIDSSPPMRITSKRDKTNINFPTQEEISLRTKLSPRLIQTHFLCQPSLDAEGAAARNDFIDEEQDENCLTECKSQQ